MEDLGYRPLKLTLTGFKGVRSGLGRETLTLDLEALVGEGSLVAIAGANGRGKTTVMDNLHPYMVMPSRAGADGLGAFSYYDHVYLPESQKELVWRHGGKTFKTNLVFRVNGKKKTEAFLFEQADGKWRPVALADGTVSDGKVETYERAVEAILGPQETFFTSVFSAQGKRPLSAFKNGEIKALLADLLGLEQVRAQGARAAEVVRLLKSGLAMVRQEQGQAAEELARLNLEVGKVDGAAADVAAARSARGGAAAQLDQARQVLAKVLADQQAAAETEARRQALAGDRTRIEKERAEAIGRLDEEGQRLRRREVDLVQRMEARRRDHLGRRQAMIRQRGALPALAELGQFVARAGRRRGLARRVVELRRERATAAQADASRLEHVRGQVRLLRLSMQGIEREAGQVALRQVELQRRFGLAQAVPCAGTDLQARCQLLGEANEAKALLPSAGATMAELSRRKEDATTQAKGAEAEATRLADAGERRNQAEAKLERAQRRADRYEVTAARAGEVEQARTALTAIDEELVRTEAVPQAETAEEASERAEIAAAAQRLTGERARIGQASAEGLSRIEAQRAQLPAPFDAGRVADSRAAAAAAERSAMVAEAAEIAAVQRHEQAKALHDRLARAADAKGSADRRASDVETELSAWSLLSKCLSNDGVIALDIDDAGPTFSALANDLLLACYGPRFTLEVITQSETAKGELREDFDIVVHDGLRDESKSLKLVSGGERVWINECLTRAIALYLAGNTGRRYGTLFCDEADGPLDPEHKRMFMAMKLEVLRLGGYACEFFVSQTPELTGMADRVIDLESMSMSEAKIAS
jgi:DNA repair protein SbcC/Rad50